MYPVCLVSSGTGGHLWPAFALGQALRARGHDTLLVTEGRCVERTLLERAGGAAESLDTRGRGIGRVTRLVSGAMEARRLLRSRDACAVIGTGGRTSVAVALAGRSLGLPLCLLEQNAVPGRANRLLSHLAERVYLGLPTPSRPARSLLPGTPLRPDFAVCDRAEARSRFGLTDADVVVLVTGGSQGAAVLNERVPEALGALDRELVVHHLAGAGHDEAVRTRYAAHPRLRARVEDVTVEMAMHYAAADLVVCRGGGGTVAELIATGRPAIIVPYPFHRDQQQLHNGRVLEAAGAGRVLEQHLLEATRLRRELADLLADPARLTAMGLAARSLAPIDPCHTIVRDLEEHVLN